MILKDLKKCKFQSNRSFQISLENFEDYFKKNDGSFKKIDFNTGLSNLETPFDEKALLLRSSLPESKFSQHSTTNSLHIKSKLISSLTHIDYQPQTTMKHSKLRWSLSSYNNLEHESPNFYLPRRTISLPAIKFHGKDPKPIFQNTIKSFKGAIMVRGDSEDISQTLEKNIEILKAKKFSTQNVTLTRQIHKDFDSFMDDFINQRNQSRYLFLRHLGEGSFGQVIECLDQKKNREPIAIKVTKSYVPNDVFRVKEVDVLERIWKINNTEMSPCVTLLSWFKLDYHLCLVFKRYGDNLNMVLKNRKNHPLLYQHVQSIAYQLLQALLFLHLKCKVIHTDIKPQNIILTSLSYIRTEERGRPENVLPTKFDVKLVDFGQAQIIPTINTSFLNNIGTRPYRAVEVILGKKWDRKVDYWSLGCVLYELYFGKVLFNAKEDSVHLAMICRLLSPIKSSLRKNTKKPFLFLPNGRVNKKFIPRHKEIDYLEPIKNKIKGNSDQSRMLSEIILNLLHVDPKKRLSVQMLLMSSVFKTIPESLKKRYRIINSF